MEKDEPSDKIEKKLQDLEKRYFTPGKTENNNPVIAQEGAKPEEIDQKEEKQDEQPEDKQEMVKKEEPKRESSELEAPVTLQREKIRMSAGDWFKEMGWKSNPFTFSILPEAFVGYQEQIDRFIMALEERHKFVYLAGPTGSGKTTMLAWIRFNLPKEFDILYVAKPPKRPEQFITLFNSKFASGSWFWKKEIRDIYEIPTFLNKRISRHLVVMFDEVHESPLDVLEWLRVLSDQVNNMSVVLAGLPVFETHLKDKLETFRKRIAAKIELVSLTKEETQDLVRKRIQHVGGTGDEYTAEIIDFIFTQSGGFPREILRVCDELVNQAILSGSKEFTIHAPAKERTAEQLQLSILEDMTPMQREIIELLAKNPMSPGEIANTTDLTKYKSRQHAVRSINNIMKRLYEDGNLERRRADKAYVYSLSGKLRTIVVRA